MADDWQSAWVEVLPDFSEFSNKANPQITSILSGAGDAGGRAATTSMGAVFGGSFFGTVLADLGIRLAGTIASGVRQGIEAGIDFIQDSVEIGSNLNESVNALNVSFGEASAGIQALGQDAATALGLSNVEFNALSVRFSAFANQVVGQGGDVVGFIDELTTRGADFASVYNLEVADALALFQSGLAGETEPLRKYGIDLSAATVASYAYANGIAEQGKQLTAQQKVQAAYGSLLAQTAVTQGDFANTSGELANQQRILAARFEDAQGRLGTALLPALTELANLANNELIPILDDVIAQVGPVLADSIAASVPAIRDLVVALAPLIPDLVELAVTALPPLIELLIAATPLLIDLTASTTSWFTILDGLLGLLSGDTSVEEWREQLQTLSGTFGEVTKWLGNIGFAFYDFQANAGAAVRGVVSAVQTIPTAIAQVFSGVGGWLAGSGRALIQGFIDGINQMLRPVRNSLSAVMSIVSGFFPRSPAKYGPFSGSGWDSVKKSGQALFDQFGSGFGGELGGAQLAVSGVRLPALATPQLGGSGMAGFMDPEERRILRDLAARVVELNVDSETVARASISGSARLTALGAS